MSKAGVIDPETKAAALKTAQELRSELEGEGCNAFCIAKIARLALCYLQAGQLDSALSMYEKFAKYDCTNYKAGLCLGLLYLQHAHYQKSYEVLCKVARHPQAQRDPALWLGLGALLFKFDRNDKAEAAYQLVLSLNPPLLLKREAFLKLGLLNIRKKSYDKAITFFKSACAGLLPSPAQFLLIGSCYELKKNMPEAEGMYINASGLGEQVKALQHLGWIYCLKTDYATAESTLTQALNLAIEHKSATSDIYYLLGRVSQMQGDFEKSEQHYSESLRLEPDNSLYLLTAGVLSAQRGNWAQALEQLLKSVSVPYRGPEAYLNIGHLYSIINQKDSALNAYSRALAIDPACTMALNRKKEIEQGLQPSPMSPQLPNIRLSDVPLSLQSVPKHCDSAMGRRTQPASRGKVARREDAVTPSTAPPAVNVLAHLKSHLLNPAEMSRSALIPSMLSTAATTPRMGSTEENAMFYPLMTSFISKLQDSTMPGTSDQPQKRRK